MTIIVGKTANEIKAKVVKLPSHHPAVKHTHVYILIPIYCEIVILYTIKHF